MEILKYKVSLRERVYYFLSLVFSCAVFYYIARLLHFIDPEGSEAIKAIKYPLALYTALIGTFLIFSHIFLIGHIRGNGIKITNEQFPDIYSVIKMQSEALGLRKVPNVYLVNGGGILNAFATKFCFQNWHC